VAGRKVFTSGEILTAADVNSFLMDQSVMVFADSSARSSAIPTPSEGMVTYVEDANRVEVYDGSAFGPIGGILQVVSTTKTNTFSASVGGGGTVSVTGLAASITPSSTSSKVLVLGNVSASNSQPQAVASIIIARDSTEIGIGDAAGSRTRVSSQTAGADNSFGVAGASAFILDEPSSVSSLTYSVDLHNIYTNTRTLYVNRSSGDVDNVGIARTASSIILMEVAV